MCSTMCSGLRESSTPTVAVPFDHVKRAKLHTGRSRERETHGPLFGAACCAVVFSPTRGVERVEMPLDDPGISSFPTIFPSGKGASSQVAVITLRRHDFCI